jgi:glycosyltransferase involved in cell wall biosynthesis
MYSQAIWPPHPHDDLAHIAWGFAEVARGDFDVVHLNSVCGVPFARFVDVPCVYTLHHHQDPATSRLYAANPGIAYVAISQRQRDIEADLPSATVIHHGLDPEPYAPSPTEEGYLLHLGRYAPEKGTHVAIEIALAAGLPIKLAGRVHPQDEAYFAAHVAPLLREPGVEELGEAFWDRKLALLRGARALVCPLQWEEPFGLIAIEAMLCGTPVLGFARGSFPEIVEEGITGFLASTDDIATLARRAAELDGFDRAACARRARERFTASVMTDAYEALYRRLCTPSRRSARLAAAPSSSRAY